MPRTLGTLYNNLQSAFSFVSSFIQDQSVVLFQTVKRLVVQYMNSQNEYLMLWKNLQRSIFVFLDLKVQFHNEVKHFAESRRCNR